MLFRFLLVLAFFFLPLFAQEPFRFVAIGDTGSGSPAQQRVADQMWESMQEHPFHLVGDALLGRRTRSGVADGNEAERLLGE